MMAESQRHRLLKWMKKVTAFVRKLTCGRMIKAASTRVLTQTQVHFVLLVEELQCIVCFLNECYIFVVTFELNKHNSVKTGQ